MNPTRTLMKLLSPAAPLALGLCLIGCSSFSDAELGQIRQRGVSRGVVEKFESSRVLAPQDVIELTRRHVSDQLILRQIEDAGVDYVLSKTDIKHLRDAGVNPPVLDALLYASDDFARSYAGPRYVTSYGVSAYDPYYYDDDFYGPRSSYPYGGVAVGIGLPIHHHWHHWR